MYLGVGQVHPESTNGKRQNLVECLCADQCTSASMLFLELLMTGDVLQMCRDTVPGEC